MWDAVDWLSSVLIIAATVLLIALWVVDLLGQMKEEDRGRR